MLYVANQLTRNRDADSQQREQDLNSLLLFDLPYSALFAMEHRRDWYSKFKRAVVYAA